MSKQHFEQEQPAAHPAPAELTFAVQILLAAAEGATSKCAELVPDRTVLIFDYSEEWWIPPDREAP